MEFNKLRIFKTVVDLGSVTKASSELHLAQPYVSRVLTELEEELGHELFERKNGRRGTKPNKYGAVLLSTAKDTLQCIEALPRKLDELDAVIGRIYLSSYTDIPELSEALKAFHRQYPDLLVHFAQPNVQGGRFSMDSDLIITANLIPQTNLQYQHLYRDRFVIVLPETYPEIHSLLDLTHCKFILPSNGMKQYNGCDGVFAMAGFTYTAVSEATNANHMLSLLRADTTCSNGALWSACELVGQDLAGVRILEVPDCSAIRWVNLAWRTDTNTKSLIELLAKHLVKWYQGE